MFSIGIPAFKGKFLKECITSVLSQTYTNFELIIVDDCSPDPIADIVNQFSDTRIRYYRNEKNIGAFNVIDNWNKCLELATGDFFVLLGDDDKLESNYLNVFSELILTYPDLDVFHCRSIIINEQSLPVRLTPINPNFEDVYDYVLGCLTGKREQFISDFIYRVAPLREKSGFFKLPLAWTSDYLSSFVACGSKGIAHTNEPIFNYRVNDGSITSTGNFVVKWDAAILYYKWIKELFERKGDDVLIEIKKNGIRTAYDRAIRIERISFIRQIIGNKGILNGVVFIFKVRKKYGLTFTDFIGSLTTSITDKILKLN
jgi:glycosyltransferase involved in cell wall biosynthesis